jgi:hypothetical protein
MRGDETMMTLAQIARNHGKAILDGKTWDVISTVSPDKVFLLRNIRVEGHWRRNRYVAGGIRHVQIARPSGLIVTVA